MNGPARFAPNWLPVRRRNAQNQTALSRFGVAGCAVIALVLVRGIVLASTPLSFDEAYYWLWSKHLAAGYLDHPGLIAFLIRGGTAVFGDTSIGVRAVPWLVSAAATWAVWRTVLVLNGSSRKATIAALMFNVMPMIAVESDVATPDAPEIAAAAFVLLFLAKLRQSENGRWWIAVGIAAGFALLAKYTAFFLGAGILCWLLIAKKQRHWFASVWPWLGGVIAFAMFAPVVVWNAQHGWISFAMQFGRTAGGSFTLRYIGEFLGGQLLLASPFIAVLAVAGGAAAFRRHQNTELLLPACLVLPAMAYFLVHSLHDRVQGNWPSFLYPAVAVLAAGACVKFAMTDSWLSQITRRAAVPVAALLVAAIYGQALFGAIHYRDPVSRLLAYGMGPVVSDIESVFAREHGSAVVTTNYALTGWLSFYLNRNTPVIQLNERSRYLNEAPPDPRNLRGPLIYVSQERNEQADYLAQRFAHVVPLEHVLRTRNGAILDRYVVFRLDDPKATVLSYATK